LCFVVILADPLKLGGLYQKADAIDPIPVPIKLNLIKLRFSRFRHKSDLNSLIRFHFLDMDIRWKKNYSIKKKYIKINNQKGNGA